MENYIYCFKSLGFDRRFTLSELQLVFSLCRETPGKQKDKAAFDRWLSSQIKSGTIIRKPSYLYFYAPLNVWISIPPREEDEE